MDHGTASPRVAAWPRTVGPAFNSDGVGRYPFRTRHANSASASGFAGQTATAVSTPNQETPNTAHRPSGSGTVMS